MVSEVGELHPTKLAQMSWPESLTCRNLTRGRATYLLKIVTVQQHFYYGDLDHALSTVLFEGTLTVSEWYGRRGEKENGLVLI
jgi:hypothetical protein